MMVRLRPELEVLARWEFSAAFFSATPCTTEKTEIQHILQRFLQYSWHLLGTARPRPMIDSRYHGHAELKMMWTHVFSTDGAYSQHSVAAANVFIPPPPQQGYERGIVFLSLACLF
jgi:hypothetical protein